MHEVPTPKCRRRVDSQLTDGLLVPGRQRSGLLLPVLNDLPARLQIRFTLRGQRDLLSCPVQQLYAEFALKARDTLSNCRAGHA